MNPLAEYRDFAATPDYRLVEEHADLVRRIAWHLVGRLPQSIDVEDLIQIGMLGLMEAAKNFKDDRGANFETYAGIRIRGAMLDQLRRGDWTPRSVHRRSREMSEAVERIEARLARAAEPAEIATEMGIELDEYFRIIEDASRSRILDLDDLATRDETEPKETDTPENQLEYEQMKKSVAAAIESLPERERLLVGLYYEKELNLREIGQVLGVSESRVCQLHGQALIRIRARVHRSSD